jgi:hypothetical protein
MSTTVELFLAATLSLASAGPIKDRLTAAYRNHLALIDEAELPAELREQFRAMHCMLKREPPTLRGEDAVRATIRKMSTGEATELASSVVRMYGAAIRANTPTRAKGTRNAGNVVALYAAES